MPCQWLDVAELYNETQSFKSTTWANIVMEESILNPKGCLLCGDYNVVGKMIPCEELLNVMENNTSQLHGSQLFTYNLLMETYMNQVQRNQYPEVCFMCASCYHWYKRKNVHQYFLTPWHVLTHFIKTLSFPRVYVRKVHEHVAKNKTFDVRVIRRICRSLSRKDAGRLNYYRFAFAQDELDLFDSLSEMSNQEIREQITKFYKASNNNSMFCVSKKAVEALRKIA